MLCFMKWSSGLALAVALVAMPAACTSAEPPATTPRTIAKKPVLDEARLDVVETATKDGSFKTLVAALNETGLAETLKGKGPFTILAPTDDAFAKLPAGTLESLLKPENKAKLTAILTYHVIPEYQLAADIVKLSSAKTVNGAVLTIKADGDNVTVDNAKVTKTDIQCSNGVIHVIDTVLMPKE
jgi:uncharacterized surface protein with fasciclin (FAS1) repeats